MPESTETPALKFRKPNNLRKLSKSPIIGRFAVTNHFNATVDALAPASKFPRLKAFLPQNLWPWVWNFVKKYFTSRVDVPTYENSGTSGVYPVSPADGSEGSIKIAIAGDWGTGTYEAYRIAQLMDAPKRDFTIHLGDVYYVGDEPEIEENCLGKSMNGHNGVFWPKGTKGSFALNGNHEMYAKGGPYFQSFLPTLGMTGAPKGQVSSFFCLEASQWRVIAIDTGYNSVGIPILSWIPFINTIPFVGGDCHLESSFIDWLRNTVKPEQNPKSTLLLSHHQFFSAFGDGAYAKPAEQLTEFFKGREFIWLWGHEHRLAIYQKYTTADNLTFYSRCLGHGGMPVEVGTPDPSRAPIMLYDTRTHKLDDGSLVGQNGFLDVTIQGPTLTLEYRDIDNILLFSEQFSTGSNGVLNHEIQNPGILKALS